MNKSDLISKAARPGPLIIRSTQAPIDTVCQRLPEISQKLGFGVLGVHDLRQKMLAKGVEFGPEVRVFEVCNPHKAREALTASLGISSALPCRISVYQEKGATVLATIKPTLLLSLFEVAGAEATAQEVEQTLVRIMEESIAAS